MPKYTLAQQLQYIEDNFYQNGNNEITGLMANLVANVLAYGEKAADYVNFTSAFLGTSNVKQALEALEGFSVPQWLPDKDYPGNYIVAYGTDLYYASYDISSGGNAPPSNSNWQKLIPATKVRDLLETLTGDNRLDASAIKNLEGFTLPSTVTDFVAIYEGQQKESGIFNVLQGNTVYLEERCLLMQQAKTFYWQLIPANQTYSTIPSYRRNPSFSDELELTTYSVLLITQKADGSQLGTKQIADFINVVGSLSGDITVYYNTTSLSKTEWAARSNDLNEAEVLAGTSFVDTAPTEITVPFNNTASPGYIFFAVPATHDYAYLRLEIGDWVAITEIFETALSVTVNGTAYNVYISEQQTQVNSIDFKL